MDAFLAARLGPDLSRLIGEFFRFGVVGTVGFVVDVAVLTGVMALGAGPYGGRVLSYIAAATATWALNRAWTFRHRAKGASATRQWLLFLAVNLVGFAINYGTYAALIANLPLAQAHPALFGTGLRKNALYDLIHGNQVEKINPATAFQWYPMSRLWSDIERVSTLELPLVNLFTEPVATQDIVDAFFFGARTAAPSQPAPRYDVGTRYAEPMGGRGHYLLSATECLGEIARFVAAERRAAS